ncbi:toll/interleukin-1 receptor domain-containing protein [bacterium]|nr:toll/interleukin-1 receptor domain-containing protein [bacterium]
MNVFISYSHEDSKIARRISKILNKLNVPFFLDEKSVAWGDNLHKKISNEIETNTTHLIPILSPASIKSQWVIYEILTAQHEGIKILPFLDHPSIEVPFFIKDLKYTSNLSDIESYFKKSNSTVQLQVLMKFKTEYGGFSYLEGKKFPFALPDESITELDHTKHYPSLTLSIINNENITMNIRTPKIEFYKPHKMSFLPKNSKSPTGISFGGIYSEVMPLRPSGKIDFTLFGIIFIEFYDALMKNNVKKITVEDEAGISSTYNNINELKNCITGYFKHSDITQIKKNALKNRDNFC